jgi:predicted PurR-regulated permease PerM
MVAALVAVILLLREVLLPFVAGMVLAYLLDPLAARMERLGMSRPAMNRATMVSVAVRRYNPAHSG